MKIVSVKPSPSAATHDHGWPGGTDPNVQQTRSSRFQRKTASSASAVATPRGHSWKVLQAPQGTSAWRIGLEPERVGETPPEHVLARAGGSVEHTISGIDIAPLGFARQGVGINPSSRLLGGCHRRSHQAMPRSGSTIRRSFAKAQGSTLSRLQSNQNGLAAVLVASAGN